MADIYATTPHGRDERITIHQPRYVLPKNLGSGLVQDVEGNLYLCPAARNAIVITISFVNTHSGAVTLDLFFKASGGTSRLIWTDNLSFAVGEANVYDWPVTLGPGDAIRATASVDDKITYVVSGVEVLQGSGRN